MKNLKITEGAWMLHKHSKFNIENAEGRSICSTGTYSTNSDNGEHLLENEANAALICEAGNVYNETGLTPRELFENVKAMREALEKVTLEFYDYSKSHEGENDPYFISACEAAEKALSKIGE